MNFAFHLNRKIHWAAQKFHGKVIINSLIRIRLALQYLRQSLGSNRKGSPPAPKVSARAVYGLRVNGGVELCSKNPDMRLPFASLAKLASALLLSRSLLIESSELQEIQIADVEEPLGSNMGLMPGDRVSVQDLLNGMILSSGNDATRAVARLVGAELLNREAKTGDATRRFISELNRLAESFGMNNSHFSNPTGEDALRQYTTARDLAVLGVEVLADPTLVEVLATRHRVVKLEGPNSRHITLEKTAEMLPRDNLIGAKTGTTSWAKACFMTWWKDFAEDRVIIVALGSSINLRKKGIERRQSDQRYNDMLKIADEIGVSGVGQ